MSNNTPISFELASLGFFFRETFSTEALVSNNWTLVGSPILSNGLVLNGTTQYARVGLPESFNASFLTIVVRFTPNFAHDDSVAHYVFDVNPTGDYYVEKTAANALELTLGNTAIVSVAAANYGAYWYENLPNILVITGTTADTSIWLNGFEIVSADATAWTPTTTSQFTIGGTHAGGSLFEGTIHEILFGKLLLDDTSCQQLTKGYLLPRLNDSVSVLTLPMNDVKVNAGGASYTPIEGTTSETEALLGSDGLTPSEMPTLLSGGGFSFDGGDFITIADAAEFSFIDGAGDLPFSICIYFKTGTPGNTAGIIGKYTDSNSGEWLVYHSNSKLRFTFNDQTAGAYFYQEVDSDLVAGTEETWVCTYDGSAAGTGIVIYRNGLIAADTLTTNGVYSQMRDSSEPVLVGKYSTNILPASSEVYDCQIFNYGLSATEALLWHEKTVKKFSGSIISEISEKKSVITVPMTEVRVNGSGESYTPVYGSSTEKEALLGSDGTTTTEFPTFLSKGGFSFDGGDFITIADADEFTFSDGSGDLPFSVCFHYKSGDASVNAGIISKYLSTNNGEFLISQQTSKLRFLKTDLSTGGYTLIQTVAPIIDDIIETWVCTSDNSGVVAGTKVYRNGIRAADTSATVGSYTQMRNSSQNLLIGSSGGGVKLATDSEVYLVEIFPYEMSAAQVRAWDRKAKSIKRGRY
jgi:hypothetical protein